MAYAIPGCKLLKLLYKIRTKHDLACSTKNIMLLHLRVVAIEVLKKLSKKSCTLYNSACIKCITKNFETLPLNLESLIELVRNVPGKKI